MRCELTFLKKVSIAVSSVNHVPSPGFHRKVLLNKNPLKFTGISVSFDEWHCSFEAKYVPTCEHASDLFGLDMNVKWIFTCKCQCCK